MARPPLPLGTWGEIRTHVTRTDDKGRPAGYRAITNYRDLNGRVRQLERHGKTKTAAVNKLKEELKRHSTARQAKQLSSSSRLKEAASLWLKKIEEMADGGTRSPGTLDTYRHQLDRHVLPALGELCLFELTTPVLDEFIGDLKSRIGAPTARTCRSILSGIAGLAVRYGALVANPVREVDRVEGKAVKRPRALSESERTDWFDQLAADPDAVRKDLPDLSAFLLATGARIGEALAVFWSEVDLNQGTVHITSTIIRVKGVGLVRKETKSAAGQRLLALPPGALAMLRSRQAGSNDPQAPVFPDSLGGFRDPSNTRRDLRKARGDGSLAWVTSHNFRKTNATILDNAGLSSREIANQLGHARPSMTQDVYLDRSSLNPKAADVLGAALDNGSEQKHG